uniref:Putative ixostatin n=1 Tax=Ixodes ricinus TaxID=34613 RepID=A0A0K8RE61_IXORI
MQLTRFMVFIGLTHLLCEAQSDSTWYVDASMNNISGGCKSKLIDEVQDKCLRTSLGSTLQFMMALGSRKPSTLSTKLADVPATFVESVGRIQRLQFCM